MPKAVSKRQFRFMQAILHGKAKGGPRGTPPKSIAGKYSSPGQNAPDQSGSNTGGTWGEGHHAKAKKKVEEKRLDKKKRKAKLRKSFDEFYKGRGVGCIVEDDSGKILIGKQKDMGVWTTPGGHVHPDEAFDEAAIRELREETGLVGSNPVQVCQHKMDGNDSVVFLIKSYRGKVKNTSEVTDLKFVQPHDLPWENMRGCAAVGLKEYLSSKLGKSRALADLLTMEKLQKNIIRNNGAVYEMRHGEALNLIGNGAFRFLRNAVAGMKDEDFKDVHIDNYTISIRRHISDVYSGRISDGHKVVHQFTNRSLPALTAELMSVFEWYLPEDEPDLNLLDDTALPDDAIEGGMNELVENYKRHNVANIYQEMENIRGEIRNGMAVDLQQVEARVMKLFDRMEDFVQELASKHNQLSREADGELNQLEVKLRELQSKIDELGKHPEVVEAFSTKLPNKDEILENFYCYLPRPTIEISPNGKMRITFSQDWSSLEKDNFLSDMKARVIKPK